MKHLYAIAFCLLFTLNSFSQCIADFSFAANGYTVQFIDLSSTSSGTITSYYWDFGDGQQSVSLTPNPTHTYAVPGCYTIKHSVQNNLGTCTDTIVRVFCIAPPPTTVFLCPPASGTNLSAAFSGSSYQWLMSTDSIAFLAIPPGSYFSGANTSILQITNLPSSYTGTQFRCITDGNFSTGYIIRFENRWTGGSNTNWSNAANWSCATLPDANTDVVITSGTIVVNANITIRSLTLSPGVNLNVLPGYNLTVLH